MILQMENLVFGYGKCDLISGISGCLQPGAVHFLCGPNGSGKSTLLKLLCGYLHPRCGMVKLNEQPIKAMTHIARARNLGVVWQNIYLGDKKIGDIALLGAKQAKNCGMKVLSAVLVEMDMDEFVPFKSRTNRYEKLREFPLNEYDVSFIIDSLVTFDTISQTAMQVAEEKPFLRAVKFVDEYKGEKIPQGKKSITIRLEIGSDEKTLTGAEIDGVANAVMDKIESVLSASVRRS